MKRRHGSYVEEKENYSYHPGCGGSEGVKNKNLRLIAGKPLVAHSVEHALGCSRIDRVFVSTDDLKIGEIAQQYGAEFIKRPAAISDDTSSSESALQHALDHLSKTETYEPDELKAMVHAIRNIEKALGDGIKKPSRSEMKNIQVVRKSIVAAKDIKKGEVLGEDNITVKRPAGGISPMDWDNILGKRAKRDFRGDELIEI